ncbi:hypothetical protein AURDEDRAFT_153157 [Auricularia subglabra TFB-10046 SS5]|nr:hypothetical protein AURDEDRAFT_153157 [Auricularia subglabra TFB-10046 SS5]
MVLTAEIIHAQQLKQEENTRKWLNDQVQDARKMLEQADAELVTATEARKAAQAALDMALAQRDAVLERALPRMSLVRRLPFDVLSEIFAHVLGGYETAPYEPMLDEDWPDDTFERAQAPFHLAAVCQTWRRAALSTAPLWTFLGIHRELWEAACEEDDSNLMQALEAYASLIMQRSGKLPLEVELVGVHSSWIDVWPAFSKVLVKLAARWQRVMCIMDLPDEENTTTILGCFRSHMPLLEHIHIQLYNALGDIPELTPVIELPSAPRLSSLILVGITLHATPGLTFSGLHNAAIMHASYVPSDYWTVLRALPQVKTLKLAMNFSTETVPFPTGTIAFDHLTHLEIISDSCAFGFTVGVDAFRMPALYTLKIEDTHMTDLLGFLQRACKATVVLMLENQHETLEEAVAQSLKNLPRLRTLSFSNCTLADAFFSTLQDERACPALQHLELHETGFASYTSDPLVRFVRARNVPVPQAPVAPGSQQAMVAPRPRPLRSVSFDENEGDKGVSCWDAAEIYRLVDESAKA